MEAKKKSKRKVWQKKWIARRSQQGCYDNLMRELALEDTESYRKYIRMNTASFEYLLEKVTPIIQKSNTRMRESIPAAERLAITLRYLATGETQSSLHFQFRVAQNTISGFLPVVCRAIYDTLKDDYLSCPTHNQQWEAIASEFYRKWNFPMCIGAMDGKHVKIVPPTNSGSTYYNYKGDFSIVLLALVDAHLRFIYVDVGTNGRISDGGVWAKSRLKQAVDTNALNIPPGKILPGTNIDVPHVIIADDAFPLNYNLMKPYSNSKLTKQQRIFNYRLSRARRVAENAFGVLAARFRIFHTKMSVSVSSARDMVLATCALHNFLRQKAVNCYLPPGSIDVENIEKKQIMRGSWRDTTNAFIDFRKVPHKSSYVSKDVQNRFCNWFVNEGAVYWQDEMCKLH